MGSLAQDENFSHLLAEARKYGLGLVLATQYTSQLSSRDPHRPSVLSAVLGNVGTVVAFRVGVEDAPLLAPLFAPRFEAQDLVELPNFQGYVCLHLDHKTVRPFSFILEPPTSPLQPQWAEALIRASQEQWGVVPEESDRRAAERRHFIQNLG
jgi:hypothetical protein